MSYERYNQMSPQMTSVITRLQCMLSCDFIEKYWLVLTFLSRRCNNFRAIATFSFANVISCICILRFSLFLCFDYILIIPLLH